MGAFEPYFWLIIVALAVIFEAVTAGLFCIWFIPAGLASIVLAIVGVPFWVQVLVFCILSIIGVLLLRKIFLKFFKKKIIPTNVDAVIGAKALVTERIENMAGSGQVKVNGQIWSARTVDRDTVCEVGEIVTVIAVEGVKLICK